MGIREYYKKHRQVLTYLFIGGCTTLVNYTIFLLLRLLHLEVNLANTLAVMGAVIFAYIANKQVVFCSHCANLTELIKEAATFVLSRIFTIFLEIGGVFLLVTVLERNEIISKIFVSIFVVILNYILSLKLAFKKKG